MNSKEEKLLLILFVIKKLKQPFITRIQKTLFIYTQEYDENIFIYVPNNYGANSFDLWDEVNFLVNNDFIIELKNQHSSEYIVTEKGEQILDNPELNIKYLHKLNILGQIVDMSNDVGSWLVSYVYQWYPKYTEKSLIIDNVIERMDDDRKKYAERIVGILRKKIQKSKNI